MYVRDGTQHNMCVCVCVCEHGVSDGEMESEGVLFNYRICVLCYTMKGGRYTRTTEPTAKHQHAPTRLFTVSVSCRRQQQHRLMMCSS